MSLRQKYLDVVSRLVAPGALGMAVLLGSAVPGVASQDQTQQPSSLQNQRVSERLAAIREAVSEIASTSGDAAGPVGERRLAWVNWNNGGIGFGFGTPWANFSPWHNWNNWHNRWHNWRNGWGNW